MRDIFTVLLGKYGLSDEQINELETEICQLFKPRTDETIEQAYFRGKQDGIMIKEMECQQRVERIFKEIERELEVQGRPEAVPYEERKGIITTMRVINDGYWISKDDWQAIKKQERRLNEIPS